jgi:hypothetical protein
MDDAPIAAQNACEMKYSPALPSRLRPPAFPTETTLDMRGAMPLLHSPRGKRPRGVFISGGGNKSLLCQVLLTSAVTLRGPRAHPEIRNGLLASLLTIPHAVPNRLILGDTDRVSRGGASAQAKPTSVSFECSVNADEAAEMGIKDTRAGLSPGPPLHQNCKRRVI